MDYKRKRIYGPGKKSGSELCKLLRIGHWFEGLKMIPLVDEIDWIDGDKKNALYYATKMSIPCMNLVVRSLIEHGADPNFAHPRSGTSILHNVATAYEPSLITFLLDRGADPNVKDVHGYTPLSYAFTYGGISSAYELIVGGAKLFPGPCKDEKMSPHQLADCYLPRALVVTAVCKELWQMETTMYDSYIQWLPKEMLEDVIQVYINHYNVLHYTSYEFDLMQGCCSNVNLEGEWYPITNK